MNSERIFTDKNVVYNDSKSAEVITDYEDEDIKCSECKKLLGKGKGDFNGTSIVCRECLGIKNV